MKKTLLTLFILAIASAATFAQITNGGFENWTSGPGSCESVSDWGTLNGDTYLVGICTAIKETSNVYGGNAALKLTTEHVVIPFPPIDEIAPGICTNGTINTQTEAVEGGDAFTERPTAFTGWYRAAPVNNDTYSFSALLINESTGDTVGSADWESSATVTNWTQFSAPVTYYLPDNPTLLQIILLPSAPESPQIGTEVVFDDLDYETITVGVNESEPDLISTYPNPVVEDLFFNLGNRNEAIVSIYNILGVKVKEDYLTGANNRISMSNLSHGTYVWQLADTDGEVVKTGKVIVIK